MKMSRGLFTFGNIKGKSLVDNSSPFVMSLYGSEEEKIRKEKKEQKKLENFKNSTLENIDEMIDVLQTHREIETMDWSEPKKALVHFEEALLNDGEVQDLFSANVYKIKAKLMKMSSLSDDEKLVYDLLEEKNLDVIVEKTKHWKIGNECIESHDTYIQVAKNEKWLAVELLMDLWSQRFRV